MAMKGYSAFPKAAALLEPHHQIVYCHIQETRWGGVLPHCREAVGVFYRSSRLGNQATGLLHLIRQNTMLCVSVLSSDVLNLLIDSNCCRNSIHVYKDILLNCQFIKNLYSYEISNILSVNLNCGNACYIVIPLVRNGSNLLNLDAFLCRYCTIVSFGSCFSARNFVLSPVTSFPIIQIFFMTSAISENVKSSNSLGYAMTKIFPNGLTACRCLKEICNLVLPPTA